MSRWAALLIATGICGLVAALLAQKNSPMKIATAFPSIQEVPDPSNVITPAQWYLLSHLSSPLIQFDHLEGRFKPLLASKWEIDGNTYRFHLRKDAKFSDGSELRANDVSATIKRQIFKRSSTHFKLWDYFENCPQLKSVDEQCPGIRVVDDHTIEFRLLKRLESFLLFLASPEAGVWAEQSIDPATGTLKLDKYSGPYKLEHTLSDRLTLKRSEFSPISREHPDGANEIDIYINGQDPIELFANGLIDFYIEMTRPFYESAYADLGLNRTTSSFNTIIYLYKVGDSKGKIGSDFISQLWTKHLGKEMIAADTFLPFGSLGALTRKEFLDALPASGSSEGVKVAVPSPFFHEKLIALLNQTAAELKLNLRFEPIPVAEALKLYNKDLASNSSPFDFVLTPYVASERFPSVQITFLLEGRELPMKLEHLDSPDSSPERRKELQTAQSWMISDQIVIPLLFVRNHIISKTNIELGDQPITDAEIQMWRIKYK